MCKSQAVTGETEEVKQTQVIGEARDAAIGKGLLAVDFSASTEEELDCQAALDAEMAAVWRGTKAGEIKDVTKETIGKQYQQFSEEHDLHLYMKKSSRGYDAEPLSGQDQFVVLDDVLTLEECGRLESLVVDKWHCLENRYREADVYVLSSIDQSKALADRLSPFVPDRIVDEFGLIWDLVGPNNGFFRLIRYVRPGDRYPMHFDLPGNRLDNGVLPGCQDDETHGKCCTTAKTFLTFNMYLNGEESFDGGLFTVYDAPSEPQFTIKPKAGQAFLFRQGQTKGYLHDADIVSSGIKTIIRIDFVYKLNESESSPNLLNTWRTLKEKYGCPYCPEVFLRAEDRDLHQGVHDNPISDEYKNWKQNLDLTYQRHPHVARSRGARRNRKMRLATWACSCESCD